MLDRLGPRLCVFSLVGHRPSNGLRSRGFRSRYSTNRLARFQAYYSTRDDASKAGDIADWSEEDHHALPPLQTVINVTDPAPGITANTLPVTLIASANELGLLQVSCVSADPSIRQCWPLEFNLRPHEQDGQNAFIKAAAVSVDIKPNVTAQALEAARARIQHLFDRPSKTTRNAHSDAASQEPGTDSGNAEERMECSPCPCSLAGSGKLYGSAQGVCGPRGSLAHSRRFPAAPGVRGCCRPLSHRQPLAPSRAWVSILPGKRSKVQEYVLWRRVAGGLDGATSGADPRTRARQDPHAEEGCTRTYPARGIIGTPSHSNEDGIG